MIPTGTFTLSADNLTGTAGNDWFSASPVGNQNTLQTVDSVVGGGGWDTIDAQLVGEGSEIAPSATGVEKLKLNFTPYNGEGVKLNLVHMPDIEKIKISNSTGDGHRIFNIGNVEDFVFFNDQGKVELDGITSTDLNFDFRVARSYNVGVKAGSATNAMLDLTDTADLTMTFNGTSGPGNISIHSNQNITLSNSLTLDTQFHTGTIKNIDVSGTSTIFDLTLLDTSGLESMRSGGAGGYTGQMNLTLVGSVKENAVIQTGTGYDDITITGAVGDGTTIMTGQGWDYITIGQNVGNDVTLRTGAKPGKDNITVVGSVGDNLSVYTEEGQDTLTVVQNIGNNAYVHMGKGIDNLVVANGTVGANANIMMGAGDDVVQLTKGVGANSSIQTGAGMDVVYIGAGLDAGQYIDTKGDDDIISVTESVQGGARILGGEGNDAIYALKNVLNASIDAGAGDDWVIVEKYVGNVSEHTLIDGGEGEDNINLATGIVQHYSIDAGAGEIGIRGFEQITISEDGTQDRYYDMRKIDGINDISLDYALTGVETMITGVRSGVTVRVEDGGDQKVKIDIADTSDISSNVVNIVTEHDGIVNYNFGLMGKTGIVNIDANTFCSTATHMIDLDGTSKVNTLNITGDAKVNLTADSTTLGVHTLNAGTQTGGVVAWLTEADPNGGMDKVVTTGTGGDYIVTGDGFDEIRTGPGDDVITTGLGRDTIYAGKGDDVILSGGGADTIDGRAGNDTIYAGFGMDSVSGGADGDIIYLGDDDKGDTLAYRSKMDSYGNGSHSRDTVYHFESGEDVIFFQNLLNVHYVGEFDTEAALETALENEGDAGLLRGTTDSILYVQTDSNNDISDDMQIVLMGVTDLQQADFV